MLYLLLNPCYGFLRSGVYLLISFLHRSIWISILTEMPWKLVQCWPIFEHSDYQIRRSWVNRHRVSLIAFGVERILGVAKLEHLHLLRVEPFVVLLDRAVNHKNKNIAEMRRYELCNCPHGPCAIPAFQR